MNGYKIRLTDGSEIGPMDLAALRTWIAQGAVDGTSLVMQPGTRRWVPLGSLKEFQNLVGPPRRTTKRSSSRGAASDEADPGFEGNPGWRDRWRHLAVAFLLLAAAGAFGWLAYRPEDAVTVYDDAPWLQMALGALALGLALLPRWDLARRGVRALLLLVSFAPFPLLGVLLAQGQRGSALLALASLWAFALGLWALLAPLARLANIALALLLVAVGGVGAVRFGYAPENAAAQGVRGWTTPARSFTDEAAGLSLNLPPGWVVLRQGNPLVAAPESARVTLADPRQKGFAWLLTEPAPPGVATADAYLERVVAQRREGRSGYETSPAVSGTAGTLAVRRVTASWRQGDIRQRELVEAGLDGWMGFALVAWMPEAAANRSEALEALADALVARGVLESRLRQSVAAALTAVPHLTRPAVEQLMARSEARVLEPEQAFRRSLATLAKGLPTLSKSESAELASLTAAVYAGVPWAQRKQLAVYIERLRRDEVTSVQEDQAMARLFKAAEERLSPARLARLRAYYDQAILEN